MLNMSHTLPHRPRIAPAWYLVPLATVIATVAMLIAVAAGGGPSEDGDGVSSDGTVETWQSPL